MSLLTFGTAGRTTTGPTHRIGDLLAGLAHAWDLWRARRAMSRLDDAALLDIGVPRGDIEAAVRHGRRALRG